jgi:hypothetical protein
LRAILPALLLAGLLGACGSPPTDRSTGVYLLLDTSGTYTEELDKAKQIISYTLSQLDPGDAFAVARIDTGSFSEKDIIAKVTFDGRPSAANNQKRLFREEIEQFVADVQPARFTDITGGLLQAIEWLNEQDPGAKRILVFSDLKEDLPEGYVRDDIALQFDGFDVVALNVTKLSSDNVDPREYLDRLEEWKQRVEAGGGDWRVVNDLDRLTFL